MALVENGFFENSYKKFIVAENFHMTGALCSANKVITFH